MMICVSNRLLCRDNFLQRIEQIASGRPDRIILREKDCSMEEYGVLAEECQRICSAYRVKLTLHSQPEVAQQLGIDSLHLSLPMFLNRKSWNGVAEIGTSVHSVEEAQLAQKHGASYLIAGHIYPTSCKPGLEPRGIAFLKAVVDTVQIPVFAIGGIIPESLPELRNAGAAGYCVMSSLMQSPRPLSLIQKCQRMWRGDDRKAIEGRICYGRELES